MDGADVLAEHADEEQLNRAEEVDPDDEGREPEVECVPPCQLQDEVDQGYREGQDREGEPSHRRDAQRHLGVVRDAQHGRVVEAEEVVLRLAPRPRRLHVVDHGPLVPEIADETAEVRVLLLRAAELLDDLAVVETEPGEVLHKLHVR